MSWFVGVALCGCGSSAQDGSGFEAVPNSIASRLIHIDTFNAVAGEGSVTLGYGASGSASLYAFSVLAGDPDVVAGLESADFDSPPSGVTRVASEGGASGSSFTHTVTGLLAGTEVGFRLRVCARHSQRAFCVLSNAVTATPWSDGGDGDDGWTSFTPSADTRIVYVSSSMGDDGNDGLSEATPKQSIEAGKALLRDGYPDWILFRSGDSWNEGYGWLSTAGRSETEKLLISSYGTGERPTFGGAFFGDSVEGARHVAIVGIHVTSTTDQTNGLAGIQLVNYGTLGLFDDFLIEDVAIDHMNVALYVHGVTNFVIRRSVFTDILSHGILAGESVDVVFEQNLVDNVGLGYNNGLPGNGLYLNTEPDGVQDGWIVRDNIVTRTVSNGIMARCGGDLINNLVAKTAIGLVFGGSGDDGPSVEGESGTVSLNVVLDGQDIPTNSPDGRPWLYSGPRGWGIDANNLISGEISDNVIAHDSAGTGPVAFHFNGTQAGYRIYDLTVERNIVYDWPTTYGGLNVAGTPNTQIRNLIFRDNDVTYDGSGAGSSWYLASWNEDVQGEITSSGNRFYRAYPSWAEDSLFFVGSLGEVGFAEFAAALNDTTSTYGPVSYPDPDRDIPSYSASIGGAGTFDDFIAHARAQSKASWDPAYTADAVNSYIREGFAM